MRTIDLRSDTVTQPTDAMRRAMYEAELGDDVYGEDPTVNRLEALAAERMGKEAALLVVSGTMGNLVALLTHLGRGDEVIMGDQAHTFVYEVAGVAAVAGAQVHTVPNLPDGMLDPEQVERAIRDIHNVHFPRTRLICLENTHNRCGGTVLAPAQMATIRRVADRHGIPVHLDGARVFNAAVSLGVPVSEIAAQVDTVQFCLSKGLAAPVGSILAGPAAFVAEARRMRKLVGGGMRQAGVIAAAGIVALEQMVDRLAEDHVNARRLAEGLASHACLGVDPAGVQTNMVMIGAASAPMGAPALHARLAERGVRVSQMDPTRFRAVTHYGITADDIDVVLGVFADVLEGVPA